jgi:hypothetical protein
VTSNASGQLPGDPPGVGLVAPTGITRRIWLELLCAVVLPAGVVAAIFLAPFASDPTQLPYGLDTSGYLWRVNLVHDLGVGSLTPEASNVTNPRGDRPGYPVVLSLLRSVTGLSSLGLIWLTPALFASALGLAAGSLASDGALERRARSGAAALAVGASAFVAWTAVGYAANLALDVVAMAAAVMTLEVARGRRGVAGGSVLLAGAALLHWAFAALFVVVLGVAAGVQHLSTRAAGDRAHAPGRRLATLLLVGAALGAGALLIAPQPPAQLPGVERDGLGPNRKVVARLPALGLPATLPLAGVGVTMLWFDRRRGRRNAAILLAGWSSIAAVAVVAWFVLGLPLPPYRWAGFALSIPVAIVLGAFALGDRFERAGRRGGARIAVALGVAATLILAGAGAAVWWHRGARLEADELEQLGTLSSYLEPLPVDTRLVLLLDHRRPGPPINRSWAGLPAARLRHVQWVEARIKPNAPDLGLPSAALARPGTVVVALDAYLEAANVGLLLGPGVRLVSGPPPGDIEIGEPPRAPPALWLAITLVALLTVLVLAGGGWAAALSDLPPVGVVSVAPAYGIAILSVAGLVTGMLGLPLHGLGGVSLVGGVALTGWAVATVSRTRRRSSSPETDLPPTG